MGRIECKCILGHKFTMTDTQVAAAQSLGCSMCPTCGNPATVSRITIKPERSKAKAKKAANP